MEDQADFEPDGTSARAARSFVAEHLLAHGCPDLVPDAELLTSELVTNATIHTEGPFTLHLDLGDGRVRVEILDHSPQPVRLRHAGPYDVHGRGLRIVDTLATDWGVEPIPRDGKIVWFELATTSPA